MYDLPRRLDFSKMKPIHQSIGFNGGFVEVCVWLIVHMVFSCVPPPPSSRRRSSIFIRREKRWYVYI